MRNGLLALLCLCGCNGLFEADPNFTGSDGFSTSDAQTSETSTEAPTETLGSSTEVEDTAPLECGEDIYEDNDSMATSNLGELLAQGPFVLEAQIGDSADEDWFKLELKPTGALRPEPSVSVVAELDTEACIFVSCTLGTAEVDCGPLEAANSGPNPGDSPGCCATTEVSLAYECAGSVERDGFAYARVRATAPIEACLPYVATIFDAS